MAHHAAAIALYAVLYFAFIVYMVRHELVNFLHFVTGSSTRRDSMLGDLELVCHRVRPEQKHPALDLHNQSDLSLNLLPKGAKSQSDRLGSYGSFEGASATVNPMHAMHGGHSSTCVHNLTMR